MHIDVKQGLDLTKEELKLINLYREREFGSNAKINPHTNAKEGASLFFMLKDQTNEILAFGKVEELSINFQNADYGVLCFSTVVSTQKGRGYGRLLVEELKKFASAKGKTLIGFCETQLLPFYRKCGLKILSVDENNFVYVDSQGNIIPNIVPGEVVYFNAGDDIMNKIISASDKTVKILK